MCLESIGILLDISRNDSAVSHGSVKKKEKNMVKVLNLLKRAHGTAKILTCFVQTGASQTLMLKHTEWGSLTVLREPKGKY